MTGEFSITGSLHRDGYQLCVDLINDGGGLLGRPVELVVSDNQSDVDTTLAQFERFINVDKVDLIFGTFSSKLTFPASSITEKAGYLHPIPSAAALRVYERGFEYLVYFQPNAAEYIGASPVMMLKDLVPADQQPKTVALAWADDFYANALIAGLLGENVTFQNDDGTEKTISLAPGELSKLGAEVVFKQQWPEGFTDWTTLAASIKAANADYLFAPVTSADEAIQLIRALKTVGYKPKGIFMSQGAQKEFGETLGADANGVVIQASWHPLANFSGCTKWHRNSPIRCSSTHTKPNMALMRVKMGLFHLHFVRALNRLSVPPDRQTTKSFMSGWPLVQPLIPSRPSWVTSTGILAACPLTNLSS